MAKITLTLMKMRRRTGYIEREYISSVRCGCDAASFISINESGTVKSHKSLLN